MTTIDDITNIKKELAKVVGTVLYVSTTIEQDEPTHYPLHVAVQRAMSLLDALETSIYELEVSNALFH